MSDIIKIDFNSDLGELDDFSLDKAILGEITSANVACGFHAGGPVHMERTVRMAAASSVGVGAHPGFPDRENFGRTSMRLPLDELKSTVLYQLGALSAFCREAGVRMQHVKPHGALYNMAAKDEAMSVAICEAVAEFDPSLIILGLSGSRTLEVAASMGLRSASEVFADRGYMSDGTLVPRAEPNAVLHDMDEICKRTVRMAKEGVVTAIDGTEVAIRADSVCLHGDNPGACEFAMRIREALEREGVTLAPLDEIV